MTEIIIGILILLGSAFILISAIGLVRFKDFYSRVHATTKASSFGILLLLTGVSIFFSGLSIIIKSALVIIFIYLTAPLSAHAIAKVFKAFKKKDD